MSTSADPKIIDLINEKKADGILTSLEYFPPRTETGVQVSFVVILILYYYVVGSLGKNHTHTH